MPSRKLLAQIVIGIGVIATFLWSVLGAAQQAQQAYEQRDLFARIFNWPATGPLITIAGLIGYVMVRKHDPPPAMPTVMGVPAALPAVPAPSLEGKFFHTITAKNRIQYQGRVLRDENGRFFVQFFSFSDGLPSSSRYLTTAEAQTVRFYDTNEQMQEAYFKANPDLDKGLSDFANTNLDNDD